MTHEHALVREWSLRFGTDPVFPRTFLDYALSHAPAYQILCDLIPDFSSHPHPNVLRNWLSANENRFITDPAVGIAHRFTRVGHKWQLRLVPEEVSDRRTAAVAEVA